ncbi:MAG: hypothetical protein ACD_52C00290G0002 [uncultured bacterium]|nr:MAG: hypothetical protein ACD_52C00290G0002 [uncultured bacterium]
MEFLPILPELYVTDFKESLEFYVDILEFKVEYTRKRPNFAFFSYQGSQLMIQELGPGEKEAEQLEHPFGRGINFQIGTDNVATIMESLKKHNYSLKRGIKDSWYKAGKTSYGCREILVNDPNGYLLRFSEDLGEKSAS